MYIMKNHQISKIQIRLNDTLPGKAGKVTLEQIAKAITIR